MEEWEGEKAITFFFFFLNYSPPTILQTLIWPPLTRNTDVCVCPPPPPSHNFTNTDLASPYTPEILMCVCVYVHCQIWSGTLTTRSTLWRWSSWMWCSRGTLRSRMRRVRSWSTSRQLSLTAAWQLSLASPWKSGYYALSRTGSRFMNSSVYA